MSQRFGVYKDFTFSGYDYQGAAEPWGEGYWDLFGEGNFNRKSGNRETIWNVQFDVSAKGGGGLDISSNGGEFNLERCWGGRQMWGTKDKKGVAQWLVETLNGRHTRSEESRVGKECVSTCQSRWSPNHK